jgi:Family of unknown function (DUF5706)
MGEVNMNTTRTPTDNQSQFPDEADFTLPAGQVSPPISRPPTRPETGNLERQPTPTAELEIDSADSRRIFADSVHKYIRENIQLADQKAAFFFTASTALLAFLYKNGTSSYWMKPIMQWNILDTLAFIAMTSLAIGSLLSVTVVLPRLPGSRRGYIFWEAVAEYESARQYSDDLVKLSSASFAQCIAEHCHDLSKVCRTKYLYLRLSIWACAIGLFGSLCIFMLIPQKPGP